jgi:hypothetical protein
MTTFPGSPRLQKGAIIGLDPFNPLASVVIFQYNPVTLTRTLTPKIEGGTDNKPMRISGPPGETIALDLTINAADQLEKGDATGLYPALASLEMLLYPKSAQVILNEALKVMGVIEVIPPEAPLTLFIWGVKRVVPVRITQFTITEEAFDPDLNPINATVKLSLQVLTYQDLGLLSAGGALFMTHQVIKEVMATIGSVGNISASASLSL